MDLRKVIPAIALKSLYSANADGAAFLFSGLVKIFRCLSVLAVILLLSVPGAKGADIKAPKILVGFDHDCPPYEFLENAKPTGFDIELMQAVADVMGFEVEYRPGPWRKVRQDLEEGDIDVLAGMYYSVDRSRLVDFSVPHTLVTSGIFVRDESPLRSYADIQGKVIIVQEGDIIHDSLRRSGLASHIVTVPEVGQALKVLASGKHDCAILPSRLQGEHFAKTFGLPNIRAINTDLPPLQYCFAVRKGNQELLAKLDEGLNLLKSSGEYRKIYEKWFGVYETKNLWDVVRYYALAIALVAALCLVFLIWSRVLKRLVAQRTAELRRSEEALRFTQYTIDRAMDQAFWMTKEGRLFYVNDAACRILGYSRDELLGMSISDIDPNYPPEEFAEHWRELRRRGSITMETLHRSRDGRVYPVEVRANHVVFDGKEYNCAFVTDILKRKRMEEDLWNARHELEKRVEKRTEELARATEALRSSEKEKSLILNITDALLIFYDPEMNILWANRAAGDSVNMNPEELRKRRCWEIWHQRQEPCIGCPVLSARDTGQSQAMEISTPDDRVWYIRAFPVKDETGRLIGMVEFTQDFTDRKQMEEALRQANLVVENSPVVLFRWKRDDEWSVELVSGNVMQFGYNPDDFLSGAITYSSIILPDDLAQVTRDVHDFCDKGTNQFRLEYRIVTKGGDIRWVSEHTNVERDAAGKVANFEGIVIDITERKLAEEELERQKCRLQELNSTLEKRVREEVAKNREKDIMLIQQNRQAAMGELLEHIAHQWKQPLTVVSLLIQNLWFSFANSDLTADTIQETINTTTDLLEHMAQTIEDFRDFYRPDKEKTVFSINDLVSNALDFISPALKHEAITVELSVDPGLMATGYPREYVQVILNLLSNARDELMERKIEKPRITIRGQAEDNLAVVTITDNAGGIPESIVHSIFELYVTTKEANGGTGIGLHMSKNIIEKNMGGSLTARNTTFGAQFRIAINMPTTGEVPSRASGAQK